MSCPIAVFLSKLDPVFTQDSFRALVNEYRRRSELSSAQWQNFPSFLVMRHLAIPWADEFKSIAMSFPSLEDFMDTYGHGFFCREFELLGCGAPS